MKSVLTVREDLGAEELYEEVRSFLSDLGIVCPSVETFARFYIKEPWSSALQMDLENGGRVSYEDSHRISDVPLAFQIAICMRHAHLADITAEFRIEGDDDRYIVRDSGLELERHGP